MGSVRPQRGDTETGFRSRLHIFLATPGARWRVLASVGTVVVFAAALRILLSPLFASFATYGFHDWDAHAAYNYVTTVGLKRYHELPFWNPWLCGGFPAWAYVEGATNLVSPYLPFYLFLPIQVAERFEILGGAVTGLIATYWLAGRFTKSSALKAFLAVAYAINGRWALQAATGHTWHLQYAWLPLALFFLDVSFDPGKRGRAIYAGMVLALMVYMGGIYPLPHAALVLVVYALVLAIARRTWSPLKSLTIASASGLGFAAPKLFPMIDLMMRYPRKIDSTEAIDLGQLTVMLTDPNQSYEWAPVAVPHWGWHEYGIYVGLWVVGAMVIGLVGGRGSKALALKVTGLLFLLLGIGAFHRFAPWTLLHALPVFSSQHVPSRFLFPAILLLTLAFVAFSGPWTDRLIARRAWVDVLFLVPVYFVAVDIAAVGRKSMEHVFFLSAPPIQVNAEFHQEQVTPYLYVPPEWSGATLLGMYANTGVVACYGVPDSLVRGAIAKGMPGYRGEAYLSTVSSQSMAAVTRWSTNAATLHYEHAPAGSLLVYNMNFDPSWRANGKPAVDYNGAVATPVPGGSGVVRFTYYPRMLNWGLLAFALTLGMTVVAWQAVRRKRKPHEIALPLAPAEPMGIYP